MKNTILITFASLLISFNALAFSNINCEVIYDYDFDTPQHFEMERSIQGNSYLYSFRDDLHVIDIYFTRNNPELAYINIMNQELRPELIITSGWAKEHQDTIMRIENPELDREIICYKN